VSVGKLLALPLDGVDDTLIAVAQTRYGGTAGCVDVALAFRVDDLDSIAGNRNRESGSWGAMKNGCHSDLDVCDDARVLVTWGIRALNWGLA
jgi:hypothetical protein